MTDLPPQSLTERLTMISALVECQQVIAALRLALTALEHYANEHPEDSVAADAVVRIELLLEHTV